MATELFAFAARREDRASFEEAMEVMHGGFSADPAGDLLERLRRISWAHPALLVYREEGEDRWSQVLLGLNKPEFGEGGSSLLDGN